MSVYFDTLGQGETVVFLHGWAMNRMVFKRVAGQLADEYSCALVDLPGCGSSATLSPYTLDALVAAVDQTFPFPVHVVGWSLGGAVATRWALTQPEKIRSLTLVASSPSFAQRDDWPQATPLAVLQQFTDNLAGDWKGTLKRFISLQTMGGGEARAIARELVDDLFNNGEPDPSALQRGLDILRETDLRPEVGALDLPVMLHYGDRDAMTPLAAGEWLAQHIKGAQLHAYRGAAHVPFLSHLDEFVAAQRAFLRSV
ncbi:pimeloyl-[acyl-carrier protein] methyl ester esterase [Silvimonas terrae]|uniref:Pimeloyl-[acyl-carrier protein] methyl ester esterase n=1 Tax=Silvimonas terrae TaxID=300266 RepID=A0A840RKB1_9NEIS|nr:pimeloyl-ACP methyl ester esterase BioH [Silvimonas terrae]MBB5192958.1 pimeloyl-[acyl-carrier protein] methyl ester esterase [Silvimonas terrae]